ncbi:MAG: hypothetical protein CMK09_01905 [Ponticaulis sp.]|nr:hypothetical protein [Ponticaulis sp.]|tara:strand:+ start:1842 stop:2927 length:1086 start_codon:yes stop_codon:yes gene_type:complete
MEREKLRAAVEADVITADQATRLEAMFRTTDGESSEGEPLRFLSNLNDVFLSIGIVILFGGLAAAFSILAFGQVSFGQYAPMISIPLALTAWACSEYFCARRKMLLPSIVLCIIWTICVGVSVFAILSWSVFQENGSALAASVFTNSSNDDVIDAIISESRSTVIFAFLGAALGTLGFYLRFRLPFSLFLTAACLVAVALILSAGFVTLLVCGLISLGLAIWFDSMDPERATRLSDNGFWLHVAAAPLLVYGIRGLIEINFGSGSAMVHIGLVSVLAVLAVLSLALNRRALIISGLVTFGWAIWNLFQTFGDGILIKVAGPLLVVGALIVLLGSGWKTVRRALLTGFPKQGAMARVFPPEA